MSDGMEVATTHSPYEDDLHGDWMLYLDGHLDDDQMGRTISYVANHISDLRERLAAQVDDQDGRYVVLCDDGSIIATDEFMVGDDVLLDREVQSGSSGGTPMTGFDNIPEGDDGGTGI